VKHTFLLDENILYFAVKGVDERGREDLTCAQLILVIARNCHRVLFNQRLLERYRGHLNSLARERSRVLEPLYLLNQLFLNASKQVMQHEEPPELPKGARIPAEDIEVVRAALITRPKFVTGDTDLREAINRTEALHLRAITPQEALEFAEQT
jgi:hypothetical protein